MIHDMATHITHRPRAEVPPAAPAERSVGRVVGTFANWAEPQVPVERRGNRWRIAWPADSLLPKLAGSVRPRVHFAHVADDAGLNPFVREPRAFAGMSLVSHGSDDLGVRRRFRERAAFVQRMR